MYEQERNHIENLLEHLREYIRTQQQLNKLRLAEKGSQISAYLTSAAVLVLLFFLTLSFAGIALGFFLASVFESSMAGFGLVAGLYLFTLILFYVNRNHWLMKPAANSFIRNFFKNKDHE